MQFTDGVSKIGMMDKHMKVSLLKTKEMDLVDGLLAIIWDMKDFLKKEWDLDLESLQNQMDIDTLVNGRMIESMEKGFKLNQMEILIKGIFWRISMKDLVFLKFNPMVMFILAISLPTLGKVKENLYWPMVMSMMECGTKIKPLDLEKKLCPQDKSMKDNL